MTHIGLAGSFGALLAVWPVVVARGLYRARHLSTLVNCLLFENKCFKLNQRGAAGGGQSAKVRWHRYSKSNGENRFNEADHSYMQNFQINAIKPWLNT